MTPLILATCMGSNEVVRLLINNKANLNEVDCMNHNALFYAVFKNNESLVIILCENNLKIESKKSAEILDQLVKSSKNTNIQSIMERFLRQ